jgi:hypothetical protein
MALTTAQLTALKADILADPTLSALPNNPDGNFAIAAAYNLAASPAFKVWRTSVPEHEITGQVSPEGTSWSWPAYIARSVSEQNGWARMFNSSLSINASLPNVRQGITDIFSGASNSAPAQRTHLAAMSKRDATRAEKLFATGTGSLAAPATMTFEGTLSYFDIEQARTS